jgi:hypothetical protein
MAPSPRRKQSFRVRANAPTHAETEPANEPPDQSPDIAPGLERKWFEFDRGAVLRQIDLVQNAIDQNAEELGMVAAEGVFEKPLSAELLRASRALHTIARELSALHGLVEQTARYPKTKRKRS